MLAFYFLPGWLLKNQPEVAKRYQVGPESPIPPWSFRGAMLAIRASALLFPGFVLVFWAFYANICDGQMQLLSPLFQLEEWVHLGQGLEAYLDRLCRSYQGGFWPSSIEVPTTWKAYGGFGWMYEILVGLFAVALAEEVFHRGYLMSALEDHWPAKRKIFGVPFGIAAVLSSLLFALGHLLAMAQLGRLATFFPALVFAWLWRRSGSLWAPALFHLMANLLMDVLLSTTFPS